MEAELVQRQGVPFTTIPAAGVHGVGLSALPGNVIKLTRGVLASRRVLREFQPDVLLFTGGYVAAPMAVAGRKIPALVYTPDIEPGMALKFLARFASTIAVTTEDSRGYFSAGSRVEVTGYPTRPDLSRHSRTEARASLNLAADLPVLLVTGGSKGARSINRAVAANLNELLKVAQVLHLTGNLDWPEIQAFQATLPPELPAVTTPTLTCTTWARRWPAPTWCSRVPGPLCWANTRCSACRQCWCRTRMPGAIKKSTRTTWWNAARPA